MSIIECGRGHLYDSEIYAVCPYCNNTNQAVYFGEITVGASGKTMPLSGGVDVGTSNFIDNSVRMMPLPNQYSEQSVISKGKTLPPKNYFQSQDKNVVDDNKTVGIMKEKLGIEPVVGWLVCIFGKQKGQDYKLNGGINTIGRSEKMDVCIKGDNTISSENHARLSYSEKTNRFNLIPAESKNIIFLNGEEIFIPTQINAYDIIDFGNTKLVFVPLCGEKFNWGSIQVGGDGNGNEAI